MNVFRLLCYYVLGSFTVQAVHVLCARSCTMIAARYKKNEIQPFHILSLVYQIPGTS